MTIYVCKSCGRAIQSDYQPNYCYADRMDTLENISDEDAARMGLFSAGHTHRKDRGFTVEFEDDVRWHPFTGDAILPTPCYEAPCTLTAFQDALMKRVHQ